MEGDVMTLSRPFLRATLLAGLLVPAASVAQQTNRYGNPEKHAPRPTSRAITQADLMSCLYVFADDSMEGRNAPLASNAKGTAYIVRELQRMVPKRKSFAQGQ